MCRGDQGRRRPGRAGAGRAATRRNPTARCPDLPRLPRYIRRSAGPGYALVGDAGSFTDPLSAHGRTDALRDAELLAREVIASFGSEQHIDDGLERYQANRDRLSVPLFDIVDRIASQQWGQTEIARLLRGLSASMTDEVRGPASVPAARQTTEDRRFPVRA